MTLLSFPDRIKLKYILIASTTFILANVVVNNFPLSQKSMRLVNSAFELTASMLVSVTLLVIYSASRKNKYVFSRTVLWLGIAMAAWAIGDALYFYLILIHVDPFISPVDVFYMASYLLLLVAILTIPGSQPPSRRRNMVFIEISILILSAVVLFAILLRVPGNPDLNFEPFTLLMVFIYPVVDVILIWIIMILYFTYSISSTRSVLQLLFAATFSILFSDLFYLFQNLYEVQFADYLVDLGYYLFYIFLFLAGFTGFKLIRTRESNGEESAAIFKQNNWIVFIPGIFLISLIGVLLVFVLNQTFIMFLGIVVLIVLIIILFVIHQYLVVADNIKLTSKMRNINAQLESKVEHRTAELSKANFELQSEMKEREKAEAHLEMSLQDLARLNKNKDKLFSILAHDLRSPLGSMMNLSSLLVENIKDFDESELMEAITALNKSATQTFELLNDLLAWSTIQMGRGESMKTVFPVSEVISENILSLKEDTLRKQIGIHSDIDPAITAFADKYAIHTILRNLLNNAIKFTPNQGSITMKAEENDKYVKISVMDNGIGISQERQKKIFRVDTVSSTPGTEGENGTGFGLILCKELIESNGGEIGFESEEGKGSTFYFTIPVNSKEEEMLVIQDEKPGSRIEYQKDDTRRLGFTTLFGDFNSAVLKVELNKLWSSSQFNPNYSVLIDVRKATFSGDSKALPEFLDILKAIPGTRTNRKFALLTETPQQVAYATMFGQFIKSNFPLTVEVFSTYEAAMVWLGV
ncbi:MAG: HAMP domain-containing sensor histidine kinase [Lentimicrobiaceae bacterium]|jgi:signal transduction histidine kinase